MEKNWKDSQLLQLLDRQLENKFAADTCNQINKDLQGISNQLIKMPCNTKTSLQAAIVEQLESILQNISSQERLAQFIYKVDLGEQLFSETQQNGDLNNLATAVLIREAKKVYLRNKFRNT